MKALNNMKYTCYSQSSITIIIMPDNGTLVHWYIGSPGGGGGGPGHSTFKWSGCAAGGLKTGP